MAPEMIQRQQYDFRLDNYGIGLVAYYLLAGHDAFRPAAGDYQSLLYAITHQGVQCHNGPAWNKSHSLK